MSMVMMMARYYNASLPEDFAVFIISHGRPDIVYTYDALQEQHYTGPTYIVIDNEDETAESYYQRYGGQVLMFDKETAIARTDSALPPSYRRASTFARNAIFSVAQQVGARWFLLLDDDYHGFYWEANGSGLPLISERRVKDLDYVFAVYLDFYRSVPNLMALAMGQSGEFLGGIADGLKGYRTKRKAMNVFFLSTERPFPWLGLLNEDTTTAAHLGHMGYLFITAYPVIIKSGRTQQSRGGLDDIYRRLGTYTKSFFTLLWEPSFARVVPLYGGEAYPRIHHRVYWRYGVPLIVPESLRRHDGERPQLPGFEVIPVPLCNDRLVKGDGK